LELQAAATAVITTSTPSFCIRARTF